MSVASTARLVFEMGLSVAGKGGFPGEPFFGGFGRFKVRLANFRHFSVVVWHSLAIIGRFLTIFGLSQGSIGHFGQFSVDFWQFRVILGRFWVIFGHS